MIMVIAGFGLAISDPLGLTAQGLETIHHNGNDKIVLKRIEELLKTYEISSFVIGMPINMDGTAGERVDITKKFIHKLK
ncbi:MAG: Holliday junction resolvase RuvX, partial [Clostridia bacterium]|nr:Holliday junction resolvase RuvX [Clostridia bacterium]